MLYKIFKEFAKLFVKLVKIAQNYKNYQDILEKKTVLPGAKNGPYLQYPLHY